MRPCSQRGKLLLLSKVLHSREREKATQDFLVSGLPVYSTIVQYRKPVYSTSVHKISVKYNLTENWFTVQVYRKPVYSTSVQYRKLVYKYNCTENWLTVQVITDSPRFHSTYFIKGISCQFFFLQIELKTKTNRN